MRVAGDLGVECVQPRERRCSRSRWARGAARFEGFQRNYKNTGEKMTKEKGRALEKVTNRRSFFKNGMVAAGAATMGAGLLSGGVAAFGHDDDDSASITKGDIAI